MQSVECVTIVYRKSIGIVLGPILALITVVPYYKMTVRHVHIS